jgi:hypothetical protein
MSFLLESDFWGHWVRVDAVLFLITGYAFAEDLRPLQWRSTNKAYQEAALEVLLTEANRVASELELPERLPITRSDLRDNRIDPPFWADHQGHFGFVSTTNYYYFANVGNRFASVVANFGRDSIKRPAYMESIRKRYLFPKTQLDTNTAYSMATQWLAKAGMDVPALEREAEKVQISAWEIGAKFVPIYRVSWEQLVAFRSDSSPPKFQPIASIEFVAPERRILELTVSQSKYIKRKPLSVPQRDGLLQQTSDPKLREFWFTTEQYKTVALETMLKEVNWAAQALHLPEKLPVESSNLTDVILGTPYEADRGFFSLIRTENYAYSAGPKFKLVGRNRHNAQEGEQEHFIASIRKRYTMPRGQINTNAAYTLATNWLAAISVDLKRLQTDYSVEISPLWVSETGSHCVPLYTVEWVRPIEHSQRRDVAVTVELLEPERLLERISIEKPEYLDRPPLVVPNRDKLLSDTNAASSLNAPKR